MNINFLQGIGLVLCVGALLLVVVAFIAVRALRSGTSNRNLNNPNNYPPVGQPRPDLEQRGTERPTYNDRNIESSGGFGSAPIPPTGNPNVPNQPFNEPNNPPRRTRDRQDDENIQSGGGFGGR